eukprot:Nitzschia sp. Nitz4//scaffold44_size153857//24198//25010//NITZ4_002700-RA/size153857-processed-gene-0.143-mRNA-1//-1//CDS//3329552094//3064//frame0
MILTPHGSQPLVQTGNGFTEDISTLLADAYRLTQQLQQEHQLPSKPHHGPLQCSGPTDNTFQADVCQSVPFSGSESSSVSNQYATEGVRPCDIVCGRDSGSFNHCGNRRFRVTIGLHLSQYVAATGKQQRSELIASIIHLLKNEVGARFLKKKNGRYVELNNRETRQKVGHALRDMSCNTQKSDKAERRGSETSASQSSSSASSSSMSSQESRGMSGVAIHSSLLQARGENMKLPESMEPHPFRLTGLSTGFDGAMDEFSSDITSIHWSL